MTKFEMLLGILFMLMSALTLAVTILMCMAMGGVKVNIWEWILILIVSSAIAGMIAMALMLVGMM